MSTTTTTAASSQAREPATTIQVLAAASPANQDGAGEHLPAGLPEIRPYNPTTDLASIEAAFRTIYTPLYGFADLTKIAFLVFCRAYLDTSPETCYVLAEPTTSSNGSPTIQGYIVGTSDSASFCAAFAAGAGGCKSEMETTPAVPSAAEMRDPALMRRCTEYFHQRNQWVAAVSQGTVGIEGIVSSGAKTLLEGKYPAHFHVAVLPEAQRQGYGAQLVDTLSARLTGSGVKGVFAATPADHEAALGMYRRSGFHVLDHQQHPSDEDDMMARTFAVKDL